MATLRDIAQGSVSSTEGQGYHMERLLPCQTSHGNRVYILQALHGFEVLLAGSQ